MRELGFNVTVIARQGENLVVPGFGLCQFMGGAEELTSKDPGQLRA